MKRYCYWTVVDGDYAEMAKATIESARRVGVGKDFHVWADRSIPGATTHAAGGFDKWGCLFKLTFLRDAVRHLNYDYFVWFDTDTYFVRNPGDILRVMRDSPLHIAMECDVLSPLNRRPDWWSCPNEAFALLMREMGVKSRQIFNVNGGLFIIHRDAIDTVFGLAMEFYNYCNERSYRFVDEPLFAYAMHMLCADVQAHTLRETTELWASDWTGEFKDRLPDHSPWWFTDYFTEERFKVSPAIVHAMRSKTALIHHGKELGTDGPCQGSIIRSS
jgi:hypothetical protein